MISVDLGSPMPLQLTLADGASDKGIKVFFTKIGGESVGSTTLTHVGYGAYTGTFIHNVEEFILATFIVYTDTTYTTQDLFYNNTSEWYDVSLRLTVQNIVNGVWEEVACHHEHAGTFGGVVNAILAMADPSTIGSKVWDALVADHHIANTFGNWVQVIYQYVRGNNEELLHPVHGLDMLYNTIQSRAAELTNEVNENELKINEIIPAISLAKNSINANVDGFQTQFNTFSTQIGDVESSLAGDIGTNRTKIDSLSSQIGTIQNNTTVRFAVPARLVKPAAGSKSYQFQLRLYDETGHPEAPDYAPTIRIKRLDTGLDFVASTPMSPDGVTVGGYYYNFTITEGTDEFPAYVEALVTENGVTKSVPAMTEITEFEADLNQIQSQLSSVQLATTGITGKLDNASYGLSALRDGQDIIQAAVAGNESKIDLVKTRTDKIPNDPAKVSDVTDAKTLILTRPSISDIEAKINLARDSIKGVSNKDNTQVYNQWDVSSLLKTNDPRLINLDAPISTRSQLTAGQVWLNPLRTLSASALTPSDIDAIWSYMTSQCSLSGSVGKRIADFLDTTVSTRATAAQVASQLSGVAQENSVNGLYSLVTNQVNENETKINDIITLANAIKSKTQNLPSSPASSSLVQSENDATQLEIANLKLIANMIKAKTDALPSSPASRQDVEQIPTNPLRSNDARLNNLDARISSISPLQPEDLEHLATLSQLTDKVAIVVDQVNENEGKIDLIGSKVTTIKAKTDALPVDPVSDADLAATKAEIIQAISLGGGSGGISAGDVWSHPDRTLTQDPNMFKADVSLLAKVSDLAGIRSDTYQCRMSTAFNNATGQQKVIAWIEKNGQVVPATECTVVINNSLGVTQWSETSSAPNSDHVFLFSHEISAAADENYYVTLTIRASGTNYQSIQSFVTVG